MKYLLFSAVALAAAPIPAFAQAPADQAQPTQQDHTSHPQDDRQDHHEGRDAKQDCCADKNGNGKMDCCEKGESKGCCDKQPTPAPEQHDH